MKKRILICDDEKNILILASAILNNAGFETTCCMSSKSMLEELAKERYDLVLTDMYLSNETGIGVFKKLKERLDIPFILFSASSEVELSRKAFEAGFKDFVSKPFGKIDLVTRVENAIHRNEQFKKIETQNYEYNQEMDMAAKLQKELSPSWIVKSGKVYSSYISRAATKLSGDLFGVYELSNNKTLYVMGDVSGHGVASAILSIGVRNYIANVVKNRGVDCLGSLVTDVNKYVCDIYENKMYLTMIFILMDSDSLDAEVVSAGHKYLYRKNKRGFKNIGDKIKSGIPLGWDVEHIYEDINLISLCKDEALFVCTDGISGTVVEEQALLDFIDVETSKAFLLKNLAIPFNVSKTALEQNMVGDDLTAVLITPALNEINLHHGVIRNIDDVYDLAVSIKRNDIGRSLSQNEATSFSLIISEWAGNLLKYVNDTFDKTIYFEIDYETETLAFYHQTPPHGLAVLEKPELCLESGRGKHIISTLAEHELTDLGSGLVLEKFSLKKKGELCA